MSGLHAPLQTGPHGHVRMDAGHGDAHAGQDAERCIVTGSEQFGPGGVLASWALIHHRLLLLLLLLGGFHCAASVHLLRSKNMHALRVLH